MTLKNESQLENPETCTIGLTSAIQLLDSAGLATAMSFDTSFEFSGLISVPSKETKSSKKIKKSKRKTRSEIFTDALRKAMRMNFDILEDLKRY